MQPKWTQPQQNAIDVRGGAVLVSAAAGSGKTAVLVERAVQLLCDPESPVEADRLLVVTFTRAAAAEMKQRMSNRLTAMIHAQPENLQLQRQQALLTGAQISTIDSFCMELVRQNFQNLEISPDFTIMDQNELAILQNDCAMQCIEAFYMGEDNSILFELVELLSSGRDDKMLVETILKIYDFSRSHPFPDKWLDDTLAMYSSDTPVAKTIWGSSILRYVKTSLEHCSELTDQALDLADFDEKMTAAYSPALKSDMEQIEMALTLANVDDWDGTVAALGAYTPQRFGPLRGEDECKEQVKALRDRVKKTLKDLTEKTMNASSKQFRDDLADLQPKIGLLFEMVKDFSTRLYTAKLDKKRFYFSDLTHLAVKLLVDITPEGYRPTEQAKAVAERFDYVLVDEYQDTNEVQDLLFTCVSRGQQNLFMVGDVKQSIYSFRQAMPEIFMSKKERFFSYDTGHFPAKIILDSNFRSRTQVTTAVNTIFGTLMSRDVGEVKYDEQERLTCGASYQPYENARPELMLIEADGMTSEAAMELEAEQIAKKIRTMIEAGYEIEDRGVRRPAMLRDFCILMRSPKNRAQVYIKQLQLSGITAITENAGGYLEAREVAAVISLLRALDNPLLDIELVAALMSPMFDFTEDDIARLRLLRPAAPFYTAINVAAEEGDAKSRAFLDIFSQLRTRSAVLPADRLIMSLYDLTGALEVFSAMPMGDGRRKNLLMLIEYAASYHKMGYKQLGGFVGFLGRLAQTGGDLAPAGNIGEGANAVRIMSIHRSKGLEFPVVILADSSRRFNKIDLHQSTLLHAKYGFACVRREPETFRQYPTVPMQAIRLEVQRSILSEEMRVLYVALTRAREKLIVAVTHRGDVQRRLYDSCSGLVDGKASSYLVGQGMCYADWILSVLMHHASCDSLRELGGIDDTEIIDDGNPWQINVIRDEEQQTETETAVEQTEVVTPSEQLMELIRQRVSWSYAHTAETKVPTKMSVSEVAHGEQDASYRFAARPKFLTKASLTPTERGNAMHKFMQFASYTAARENLEVEIERMRFQQFLSNAECDGLQADKLEAFFSSKLADRIFASENMRRELRFMALCGHDILSHVIDMQNDSKVVLQGVADCVFFEADGAVIVDYKTDRVKSAEELRERYKTQLELYRMILSESLEVNVKECVLYSFYLSKAIVV